MKEKVRNLIHNEVKYGSGLRAGLSFSMKNKSFQYLFLQMLMLLDILRYQKRHSLSGVSFDLENEIFKA